MIKIKIKGDPLNFDVRIDKKSNDMGYRFKTKSISYGFQLIPEHGEYVITVLEVGRQDGQYDIVACLTVVDGFTVTDWAMCPYKERERMINDLISKVYNDYFS